MKDLRQNQKQQAVLRMRELKLSTNVIKDFTDNNTIYYSERQNAIFDGVLYWVSNDPSYVKIIKDFETKHNALVYHAQLVHTQFGDLLSLLYVSKHEEEWKEDLEIIEEGYVIAYVYNLDYIEGEFGYIGVAPKNGGISRTY